jgi:hypothetical protein
MNDDRTDGEGSYGPGAEIDMPGENCGFLGSSEFQAFPMAVLVSSSNGCAIRRAFSHGDKGPCD